MSRRLRPNLPGVPFHITARIQNREPLLAGFEGSIARLIHIVAGQERCSVLAYAVMANHLHVLLVQGRRPLATFMQPLLRRIAVLVQSGSRREGHVFGRRYADQACIDPQYLRDCITYIHLNPVRAGTCHDPGEYEWTSHHAYAAPVDERSSAALAVERGLRVFASGDALDRNSLSRSYRRYVAWRVTHDRAVAAADGRQLRRLPAPPCTVAGDGNWWSDFGLPARAASLKLDAHQPAIDLERIAGYCLADAGDGATLDVLRSGSRSRPVVRLRRDFIARALTAGHRPSRIAKYLRISDTTVSATAARLRTVPA